MSRKSTPVRSVASATTPDVQPGAVVPDGQLRAIVERIEKLEEDRSANHARIREKYKEAEGKGYNVKALRKVMRERRQDAGERAEMEATWTRIAPSWAWPSSWSKTGCP